MSKRHTPTRTICAQDGCERSHSADRWNRIKADDEGWFHQKNGDAWCPEHVPGWVAEWRAKQKGATT